MRPELRAVAGSPLWQAVFVSFAIVLILFEVVRGWRLGLLRQLVRVAALAAAYAAAFFGGRLVVPIVRPFLKMPDIILSILGGAVLALVVYALVTSIGTILFKRTGQQNSKLVRVAYGLAGAVVGLFFGTFLLWMIVVSIRAVGAVADAQVRSRASSQAASQPASLHPVDVRRRFLSQADEESPTLATSLARLKNSLELGTVGDAVKRTDPIPSKTYEMLGKAGNVFSNPESAQRFLTFPGARELNEHPKIVALRNDPEISDMIAQRRFLDLLQDQRIIDAANDSMLREQINKFDLERALDYSIQGK
jgi:membrane protein required for colicin V production